MLQLLYSVPVLSIPNAVYVCSYDDYGSPDAKHCNELIEGSQKRGRFPGIAHLDPWNHAFLIEGFAREDEFTPSQWARRIYLPYLINNPHIRKSSLPLTDTYQESTSSKRFCECLGHCRIALFARGFEHDTAYWSTIAADARKIMGKCLDIPGVLSTGGGIYTGKSLPTFLFRSGD